MKFKRLSLAVFCSVLSVSACNEHNTSVRSDVGEDELADGIALELDRNQADQCYRFQTTENLFLDVDYPYGGTQLIPDVNVKVAAEEKAPEVAGSIMDARDSQTYRLQLENDGTYSLRVEKGGFYLFVGPGGDVKMGNFAKRNRFTVIASRSALGKTLAAEPVALRLTQPNHPQNGKFLNRDENNSVKVGARSTWIIMNEGKCELK